MEHVYRSLLSKDVQPDNRSVHFRSSGVFISNIAGLRYNNHVHNRLFVKGNKTRPKGLLACGLFSYSSVNCGGKITS